MAVAQLFSCECGYQAPRWFGRCPDCGAWSSASIAPESGDLLHVRSLDLPGVEPRRFSCGIAEVDRVLGGGFVPGEAVLLAGEPGIGKSTLVLQMTDGLQRSGKRCLLVTGEESLPQVALRVARVGLDAAGYRAAASQSLPVVLEAATRERADVLVVDSIQTLADPAVEQPAGSPTQVRACAAALVRLAKASEMALILVGHVTKEGAVAGPKTLEHVVDAVLTIEGERGGAIRLLRAAKNRFGSCEETGVFVMGERGLEVISDPSSMLLADRSGASAGSCVFPTLEGTRPLLVELQALVTASPIVPPRRVTTGIDGRRLALLLGVLAERAGVGLGKHDVFVATAGGLAVREPAADLALCLALVSAARGRPLACNLVAIGEVGLGGEVRRVPSLERRLNESARLGFDVALVPRNTSRRPVGMEVHEVHDLSGALSFVDSCARVARARSDRCATLE